jgi:ParB-like chromosome segregation protein Spo0J
MRRVGRNYTSDKPVKVWKDDEGYKLIDGHHRCVGHYLNGNDYVKAKVFSAQAEEGAQ